MSDRIQVGVPEMPQLDGRTRIRLVCEACGGFFEYLPGAVPRNEEAQMLLGFVTAHDDACKAARFTLKHQDR